MLRRVSVRARKRVLRLKHIVLFRPICGATTSIDRPQHGSGYLEFGRSITSRQPHRHERTTSRAICETQSATMSFDDLAAYGET
jgi:hypothetical protein